jgi:hypothetical protein
MKLDEATKILNNEGYELLKEDVYETGISDEEYAAAYNFLYDNKLKNIQKVLKMLCKFINENCNTSLGENDILRDDFEIGFTCNYDTFDKDKDTSFDVLKINFRYYPTKRNILFKRMIDIKKGQIIDEDLEIIIECDEKTKYKLMLRNVRKNEHYYFTDYKRFLNTLKHYIIKFEDDMYFKMGEEKAKKMPKNVFSLSKFIDDIFNLFNVKD